MTGYIFGLPVGEALFASRLFDIGIWAVVAVCLLPSFIRMFTSGARRCDDIRAAMFFVSLWIVGNYAIRISGSETPATLAGLNAIAAAVAVYVLLIIRQGRVVQ